MNKGWFRWGWVVLLVLNSVSLAGRIVEGHAGWSALTGAAVVICLDKIIGVKSEFGFEDK